MFAWKHRIHGEPIFPDDFNCLSLKKSTKTETEILTQLKYNFKIGLQTRLSLFENQFSFFLSRKKENSTNLNSESYYRYELNTVRYSLSFIYSV